MNVSGNYLGTCAAFIATPPNGGSFDVDVEHETEGQSEASRIEQLHSVGIMIRPAIPKYTDGRIYINFTTTDQYGRTQNDVYSYLVDTKYLDANLRNDGNKDNHQQ